MGHGVAGGVGGFLAGLIGYRARPSALEVVAYAVYLAGASVIFFPRRSARSTDLRATGGG